MPFKKPKVALPKVTNKKIKTGRGCEPRSVFRCVFLLLRVWGGGCGARELGRERVPEGSGSHAKGPATKRFQTGTGDAKEPGL